jgi:hypothetical protein
MGWFSSTRRETAWRLTGAASRRSAGAAAADADSHPAEAGGGFVSAKSSLAGVTSLLLESHGIRAPSVARHEALRARQSGDLDRAAEWAEIALRAEAALSSDV